MGRTARNSSAARDTAVWQSDMRTVSAQRRWITRRTAALSLLASLIGLLSLGLTLEHRPAWYIPAVLDAAGVQSARRDATRFVDQFGDRLVAGKPFEIVLRDEALNTWLTALPQIWPDAAQAMPSELYHPAIRFESGLLYAGAMYDVGGWRAIVSVAMTVSLSNDGTAVRFQLVDAYCGSAPLPRFLLARFTDPRFQARTPSPPQGTSIQDYSENVISSFREVRSIDQLFRGIRVRNRFVWPNGKRPFRIVGITINPDELRLRIEPLSSD